MSLDPEGSVDARVGRLLVQHGLISETQLAEALSAQTACEDYRPIGQVLVDQSAIAPRAIAAFLARFDKRSRLGEILVRSGTITDDQLEFALTQQKDGSRLGEVLIKLQFTTEAAMRQALCLQLNVPFLDLDSLAIPRELSALVNQSYATRYQVIPVARTGNRLTVAIEDPSALDVLDEVAAATGCQIDLVASSRESFRRAFERLYGVEPTGGHRLEIVRAEESSPEKPAYSVDVRQAENLVRQLIALAIERRASDIHLETLENRLHVRFRIDGVLQMIDLGTMGEALNACQREVVSRIKILGNADIAERRRPQDGSFRVRWAEGDGPAGLNLRVSVIPGYFGESVVLRILDPRNAPQSLEALGFSRRLVERLHSLLSRPSGIILLAGPTGCGKSTTLHAALRTIYRPGIKILTAEDPIEYVYDQFIQSEVNERIGNTFATYLRAFLRHDPEVMMVGEIRDPETASMAFRAAQTGHLLLSTLHTTHAVGAVSRLLDLGVDRNLVSSSLLGVLSQRLVRLLCPGCRVADQPEPDLARELFGERLPAGVQWWRGTGCARCNFTGYQGRTAVGELWVPNERDVQLINKGAPFEQVRESSTAGTIGMAEDVWERLVDGRTTLAELVRSLPYASVAAFSRITAGAG